MLLLEPEETLAITIITTTAAPHRSRKRLHRARQRLLTMRPNNDLRPSPRYTPLNLLRRRLQRIHTHLSRPLLARVQLHRTTMAEGGTPLPLPLPQRRSRNSDEHHRLLIPIMVGESHRQYPYRLVAG